MCTSNKEEIARRTQLNPKSQEASTHELTHAVYKGEDIINWIMTYPPSHTIPEHKAAQPNIDAATVVPSQEDLQKSLKLISRLL